LTGENEPMTSNDANPSGLLKNDRIVNWEDLAQLIELFSSHNIHDWLFRGVRSHEYKLIPKVGRLTRKIKRGSGPLPYSERDETAVFKQFCDVSMPFVQRPPQIEIEWLAIAQHHGLPTRFLDWTESLLVAAWFAVGEYDSGNLSVPAIWIARGIPRVNDQERERPFGIGEPRSFRPPHISPRIAAQLSVLTIHGDPTQPLSHDALWQLTIEPGNSFI
jgi:hypothetical protein